MLWVVTPLMDCQVCVLPFELAEAVALPPPVENELTEVPPVPVLLLLTVLVPPLLLEVPEPAGYIPESHTRCHVIDRRLRGGF